MSLNLLTTKDVTLLAKLEWDSICLQISEKAHFDETKSKLSKVNSFYHDYEIESKIAQLDDFVDLVKNEFHYQFYNLIEHIPSSYSLNESSDRISKGVILPLSELNNLALITEAMRSNFFVELSEDDKKAIKAIYKTFVTPFRKFVSKKGEVNYEDHPQLSKQYLKLNKLEQQIRSKLKKIREEPLIKDALQFTGEDIINDTFVLAIRSDHYTHKMGQIIERSETGNTYYILPFELYTHSTTRIQIKAEIDEIINKIEIELNRLIQNYSLFLCNYINIIKCYDYFLAKAQFCFRYHFSRPEIDHSERLVHAEKLFHPLIENPIKNDVFLTRDTQGLIISGPNTGGKTVLLKSIILTQLFLYKGMYTPTSHLKTYLFKELYYVGNDNQNLNDGLSSFSSEVKSYLDLCDEAQGDNLVVIDEIYNTTSSEQASALAIATIEKLVSEMNSLVLISTHHQQIKNYFHNKKNYISCHMSFDSKTLKPTYKIIYGSPGSSLAIEVISGIWKKNKNAQTITERAKELLSHSLTNYEELLSSLSNKQTELDHLLEDNKKTKQLLNDKVKSANNEIKIKIEREVKKKKAELEKIIDQAKESLKDAKNKHTKSTLNQLHELKREVTKDLFMSQPVNPQEPSFPIENDQSYFSSSLRSFVKILSTNTKKKIAKVITKNNISVEVPFYDLVSKGQKNQSKKNDVKVNIIKSSQTKINIDCRGMRLNEFQHVVNNHVLNLLSGDVPFLIFIHGHGEAILKNWLRNYVKTNNELKMDISESTNDGETKIVLNE
jgi:DNA mismatch repair protein MutS2